MSGRITSFTQKSNPSVNNLDEEVEEELIDEQTRKDKGIEDADEVVNDENSINFGTVKKILLFWGLTVPVAMGVAYIITALLLIG